jgi:ATP synthase F1 gamma subunit
MPRKSLLLSENVELEILQTVTSAYSQIASMWLNRTRDTVLRNRVYLEELNHVFLAVFSAYTDQIRQLIKQKNADRSGKITLLAHNGKKVAVFLSANTGFYGDIINRTFELFLADVRKNNYEVTIVGKQGVALFNSEEPNRPKTIIDISDDKITPEDLRQLARHLVQYEEIRLYYGKFKNFLMQEPVTFRLSADPYSELEGDKNAGKHYIFEPDIEHILMFFEKQMFTSLLDQSVRESQLAKYASRIMVMDRASENIKDRLKFVHLQQLRADHRLMNQKQLNQYASLSLWKS